METRQFNQRSGDAANISHRRFATSNNFNRSYHPARSGVTGTTELYRSTASPTSFIRTYANTTYTPDKNDYKSNTLSPTTYGDQDRLRSPLTENVSKSPLGIQDKNERAKSPLLAAGMEEEEDPRTEIRKACEALRQLQKIDLEAVERKYRALMESVEPEVLSREELYASSSSSLKTKSSTRGIEERLRKERDELRSKVAELQAEVDEERGKQSQVQQKYTEQAKKEIEDLHMKLQEEEEKILKRKTGFEDAIVKFQEKEKELENQNASLKEQLDSMKDVIRRIEREKNNAEREKTDALTRLSKEMGTKLNERNPNIADLSDSNRPTKLAEKYSELYDNEWTDALEHLVETVDEEAAIKVLLQIMQTSYQFCKDAASNQIRDVQNSLASLSRDRWTDSTSKVPTAVTKLVKECQKEMRMETTDILYNEYMKSSTAGRYAYQIPEYVKKCLALCWRMVLQDPQVVFGKPAEAGATFDSNMYKEYTKTGSIVSFTVWMPLLLHENGPLLSKGTAQPVPSKPPQRAKSAYGQATGQRENTADMVSSHRPTSAATVSSSYQRDKPRETDIDDFFNTDQHKNISSKQREKRATPESMGVSKTHSTYESSNQHTSHHDTSDGLLGYPAENYRTKYGTGPRFIRTPGGYYCYYYDGRLFSQKEWDRINASFANTYQGSSFA